MAATAAVVGAVATVGGTAYSINAQQDASRAQKKQQTLSTRASRRQAIREAQLSRAQAVALASASGATGSSAAAQGQGSIQSQLGTQLGFSGQMSGLSRQISSASGRATFGKDIAGLGGSLFSYGAARGGLDNLSLPSFGSPGEPRPPGNTVSGYRP